MQGSEQHSQQRESASLRHPVQLVPPCRASLLALKGSQPGTQHLPAHYSAAALTAVGCPGGSSKGGFSIPHHQIVTVCRWHLLCVHELAFGDGSGQADRHSCTAGGKPDMCLQALPASLDPDSVLEGAWAQSGQSGGWAVPEGLDPSLEAFRTWLRHLLWELTLLLVQVWLRICSYLIQSCMHL